MNINCFSTGFLGIDVDRIESFSYPRIHAKFIIPHWNLYFVISCLFASKVQARPFSSQSAVRASCSSEVTQGPALFAGTVHRSFRQPGVDFFNIDTSAMYNHNGPTTMRNYLKVFIDNTVLRTSQKSIGANYRWPRPDLGNSGGALQFCGVGSLVGIIKGRIF